MDIIFLRNLRVSTIIGIYDWEKTIKQELNISLRMGFDIQKAALSDNINDTLDYKAVAKSVSSFVEQSSCNLVEKLAEEICQHILQKFAIVFVELTLDKGTAVTGAEGVGVQITRYK